jgi:hypothetical protein
MGKYNFDHIAFFAIKRFVEGWNTVDLLGSARTELEKEEIALVCLLHLDDNAMDDLHLCCHYDGHCKAISYRNRLKKLIKEKIDKIA